MAEKKEIYVRVLKPEGSLYEGYALAIRLPGVKGSFSVLPRHAPIISQMEKGKVIITKSPSGEKEEFEINGGFVQVLNNEVIALVE